VTGGARGLGNAVAVSFAKRGARAVVLVDIQDESTFTAGKNTVEAYGTEVSLRGFRVLYASVPEPYV
jgi:NAD(P)-dependent dehydrogenase (short-subunit alcohol dehydrogenase family)